MTAGGRGSRISELGTEKPLVPVAGVPMIDRMLDQLGRSERLERIYVSVSPLAPRTREHLLERDVVIVDTPGNGYVADLTGSMRKYLGGCRPGLPFGHAFADRRRGRHAHRNVR